MTITELQKMLAMCSRPGKTAVDLDIVDYSAFGAMVALRLEEINK